MIPSEQDLTLILAQIGIFVVLWIALKRLWFDPIAAVIGERARRSEGAVEEARAVQEEAARLRVRHAEEMDQARAEAQRDVQGLLRDADAERRKIVTEATEAAERILSDARGEIASEVDAARAALRDDVSQIARQVAQAVVGRAV